MAEPQTFRFEDDGAVPNNPRLPALLYPAAFDTSEPDLAGMIEAIFASNGWPPEWRADMLDYRHYHSTAHEALGIVSGRARVELGGRSGAEVEVGAGDALVLPAGTGHRKLSASDDFLMVGAYPEGANWDLIRAAPSAHDAALARIAKVPLPALDPIAGPDGPLTRLWRD